ncbi:hypothetical protein PAPYR_1835 [Paratrimastix pyriformis]|uniref:Uncharacterized protein n=1 Tax=Paratrimastix pyriformis TaxID=342808 RepID=A0ABQ8UVX0_9EUKA|nr:hypothetical protein PAPYR_1835 [Paratrimastix pyriformis]
MLSHERHAQRRRQRSRVAQRRQRAALRIQAWWHKHRSRTAVANALRIYRQATSERQASGALAAGRVLVAESLQQVADGMGSLMRFFMAAPLGPDAVRPPPGPPTPTRVAPCF